MKEWQKYNIKNIRKGVNVKLITNEKMVLKYGSKPTVVNTKIFNSNLVAILKKKEAVTLKKLAYVGMTILHLSKTLMYDFHYNYIKKT